MQQELIEMLEETIQYVEVWNAHDQGIIDKAEALIEKAKKSAKEPAVLQGEPVGVVYSFPSGDGNTAWGFKPNDSAWEVEKQPKSYERRFNVYLQAAHAPPSQEPALHIGACITDGVLHATVMRRESNGHVTILATAEMDAKSLLERDCLAKLSPTPSQPVTLTDEELEECFRRTHEQTNTAYVPIARFPVGWRLYGHQVIAALREKEQAK